MKKTLTIALLILIPTVTKAEVFYDRLVRGTEVFDYYDPTNINEKSGITLYRMKIEKTPEGNFHDTISDMYIETTGACKKTDKALNAVLLVKKQNKRQLFMENGQVCGVRNIFK